MMTKVHTISIVPKNAYSGKAGGRAPVARAATKVSKTTARVSTPAAKIFASRFALNRSSRHATIMAMGISNKSAEPSRAPLRERREWISRANNIEQGKNIRIQLVEHREDPQERQPLLGVVHFSLPRKAMQDLSCAPAQSAAGIGFPV